MTNKDDEFLKKIFMLCKEYEKIGILLYQVPDKRIAFQVLPPVLDTETVVDILNKATNFAKENYKPVDLSKMPSNFKVGGKG